MQIWFDCNFFCTSAIRILSDLDAFLLMVTVKSRNLIKTAWWIRRTDDFCFCAQFDRTSRQILFFGVLMYSVFFFSLIDNTFTRWISPLILYFKLMRKVPWWAHVWIYTKKTAVSSLELSTTHVCFLFDWTNICLTYFFARSNFSKRISLNQTYFLVWYLNSTNRQQIHMTNTCVKVATCILHLAFATLISVR